MAIALNGLFARGIGNSNAVEVGLFARGILGGVPVPPVIILPPRGGSGPDGGWLPWKKGTKSKHETERLVAEWRRYKPKQVVSPIAPSRAVWLAMMADAIDEMDD